MIEYGIYGITNSTDKTSFFFCFVTNEKLFNKYRNENELTKNKYSFIEWNKYGKICIPDGIVEWEKDNRRERKKKTMLLQTVMQ